MALAPDLGHLLHPSEFQASGGAIGHAGRLESLVNTVFAVVTFGDLSRFRIPLGSAPGTGGNTGLASDAEILVNKDDTVFITFLHGTGGAGGYTPGIFAVKTGHENIRTFGYIRDELGAHFNDLAGLGSLGQIFVGLAGDFAAAAPDTFFGILKQVILTHAVLRICQIL